MITKDLATWRAAEARALIVALAVAAKAGWRFEAAGPVLSTPFAGYLYVEAAELLLVPTSAALPFATRLVEQATREARSDALVPSPREQRNASAQRRRWWRAREEGGGTGAGEAACPRSRPTSSCWCW